MNRREMMRASGLALIGLHLPPAVLRAFATARGPRPPVDLAVVRASWDRVIKTTVGLRPHRDAGFVLRAERFGDRPFTTTGHAAPGDVAVVGSRAMAADLALTAPVRRAAGRWRGAVGLCAASSSQPALRRHHLRARRAARHDVENLSLPRSTPTSVLIDEDVGLWRGTSNFVRPDDLHGELHQLAGDPASASRARSHTATDEVPHPMPPPQRLRHHWRPCCRTLRRDHQQDVLAPGEHPFPTMYAVRTNALALEPAIYLEALVRYVVSFAAASSSGASQRHASCWRCPSRSSSTAHGLVLPTLFGDRQLIPVKGQLTSLVAPP